MCSFIGMWNERPSGPTSYTIALRQVSLTSSPHPSCPFIIIACHHCTAIAISRHLHQSLDAAGFKDTKIILPDGPISNTLVHQLRTDAVFSSSVYALGQHG